MGGGTFSSRVGRPCRYDTGHTLCGAKTQNLVETPEGRVPMCAYHAQCIKKTD